jgi:hypothetical protein
VLSGSGWRSRVRNARNGVDGADRQRKEINVYVIPIIVLAVVIAISAVWAPVFAFVIAIPLFLLFLAYVGFSRRADQKVTAPGGKPASGEGEAAGGIWGEKKA